MTDQMENAARAFDTAMGRAAPVQRQERSSDALDAPEPIFGNLGEHTEDSDEQGGGDDLPPPKPKKTPKEQVADPDDEDEDEDEDPDADPDEDEDEDEDEGLTDEEKAAKKAAAGDEDDDEAMNQEFTVMVDGVEKTVKLKEALEGYIRTDTFHQRLNKLNEVQSAITEEAQAVVRDRTDAQAKLKEAEDILTEMMPAEPDWDAEFAKDGVRANALRKQYETFKSKVAEIRTKRETVAREAADNALRETTKFAKSEYPKFANAAGWKTQEDQVRDTKSMRKTALNLGFSEEEIGKVYDSRFLQVLLKASKYDRMMASRPKPVQKNGKQQVTLGAGRTVQPRTAPKGINAAQSRLSKTGSLDDAASVFGQILSQSRKRNR